MTFHNKPVDDVAKELSSDLALGLSDSQIPLLLGDYGENKLKEKKETTNLQRFLDQFKDIMIL